MECEKCKKQCKNQGSLKRHIKACINNNLTCEYCNHTFCDIRNLHRHHKICKPKLKNEENETNIIELLKLENSMLKKENEFLRKTLEKFIKTETQ